jgi:hypothetical protein
MTFLRIVIPLDPDGERAAEPGGRRAADRHAR